MTKSAIEQFRDSKPLFGSRQEAIAAFQAELNEIAMRRSQTVEDLLHEAEHSPIWSEDLSRAHSLGALIGVMKGKK